MVDIVSLLQVLTRALFVLAKKQEEQDITHNSCHACLLLLEGELVLICMPTLQCHITIGS